MAININVYGNDDNVEEKIKYVYLQERNGSTPYPGTNGNWWINGKDTGMRAVPKNLPNIDTEDIKKQITQTITNEVSKIDFAKMLSSNNGVPIHKHSIENINNFIPISNEEILNLI